MGVVVSRQASPPPGQDAVRRACAEPAPGGVVPGGRAVAAPDALAAVRARPVERVVLGHGGGGGARCSCGAPDPVLAELVGELVGDVVVVAGGVEGDLGPPQVLIDPGLASCELELALLLGVLR